MNAARPLVSVLCATYQYGPFLQDAIESVLTQTYPAVEMIVVDDGSSDDTPAVMDRYRDRVTCIRTANRGQNAAFNTAFARSRGEIVCLLDADDRMAPGKAARLVEIYAADPTLGWVFHGLRYVDLTTGNEVERPSTAQLELPPEGRHDERATMRAGRAPIVAPAASGLSLRREVFAALSPLPELKEFGDHFIKFGAMAMAPGWFCGEPLADQGIHGSNAYTNRSDITVFRARRMVNLSRELQAWNPELSAFSDRLLAQGIMMSRYGRQLPAAERASVRAWWHNARGGRRASVLAAVASQSWSRARKRLKRG